MNLVVSVLNKQPHDLYVLGLAESVHALPYLHLHSEVAARLYHKDCTALVLTILSGNVNGVSGDADFRLRLIVEPENSYVASRCGYGTIEEHGADTDELVKGLS